MKNILNLFVSALFITSLVSCGDKKKTEEPIVAPQGMHVLDLTNYGKSFAIFVPDTTAAKLTITEQPSGALEIRVGKSFGITVNEQAGDIEAKKRDMKDDEVYKFKAFLAEEPTAIFWELNFMDKPIYHFMVNMKIGTSDYCFEDIVSTESEPYSKDAVQKMFESAKSIKEKKKEQPST
jgi:hypothetical protein